MGFSSVQKGCIPSKSQGDCPNVGTIENDKEIKSSNKESLFFIDQMLYIWFLVNYQTINIFIQISENPTQQIKRIQKKNVAVYSFLFSITSPHTVRFCFSNFVTKKT